MRSSSQWWISAAENRHSPPTRRPGSLPRSASFGTAAGIMCRYAASRSMSKSSWAMMALYVSAFQADAASDSPHVELAMRAYSSNARVSLERLTYAIAGTRKLALTLVGEFHEHPPASIGERRIPLAAGASKSLFRT